jgi:hypothetical protein
MRNVLVEIYIMDKKMKKVTLGYGSLSEEYTKANRNL